MKALTAVQEIYLRRYWVVYFAGVFERFHQKSGFTLKYFVHVSVLFVSDRLTLLVAPA